MKVTKLGYKSKRRMTLKEHIPGGTVVRVAGDLYIVPTESEIEFDWCTIDEEEVVVLINLENGDTVVLGKDTNCEIVKNAQLGYYEEDICEWIE